MSTMIDLIVHMDCSGCENKIKKALQKIKGVDDVEVDINMQKVTVSGWAEQEKILKTIRKTGRRADLWPYTAESQHNATVISDRYNYHQHDKSSSSTLFTAFDAPAISYNYLTSDHTTSNSSLYDDLLPYSTLLDDQSAVLFSDDNAHACSIM